jgi:NTP pyrophosphatase (non-canonical NTP hydrolase)
VNSKDYIQNAKKTESINFYEIQNRFAQKGLIRLLHAGMGLTTESAEFLDSLKKQIFYGKGLDRVNLAEEIGDLFWYCAIIADELGFNFEEVMEKNIEKLKSRYGELFSEEKANSRNLDLERRILEGQNFHEDLKSI